MALVEVNSLNKNYRMGNTTIRALKGINVDIEEGTFVSVVGPSGSGKSTLLNIIGCLDQPDDGSVKIKGKEVSYLTRKERAAFRGEHLGFIFQNFNLIPVLTVYENVEYPLLMVKSKDIAEKKKRILELLEAVGVLDQKDKLPGQISGGQMQRVAIARALVTQPALVIADEPTANLDHDTAYKIINLMKKMQEQWNTTFIFSTHDPKIINEAEIIFTLEDGNILGKEDRRTHV